MYKTALINLILKEARWIGKIAIDFPTQDAYDKYMKEHPDADPKHHSVVKTEEKTKDLQEKIDDKKKELGQPKKQEPQKETPKEEELKTKIEEKKQELGKQPKVDLFDEKDKSLPTTARQPNVKSEDDFYSQAKEAQDYMMTWLDKGEGLEKDLKAKHYEVKSAEDFKKVVEDLDKPGKVIITAPLKGKNRAEEKVKADYKGDWSKLTDGVRATIAVDKIDELEEVMKKLKASGMQLAKAPKDRFAKPTAGYRDILMNVKYPNGHIGEVQLHVKAMLKAKEEKGHKLYEQARTIGAKTEMENREMNEEERKQFDALEKEQTELFDGVWNKVIGKAASKTATDKIRYYEFKDKPVILKPTGSPIMVSDGKKIIVHDLNKFLENAIEIDKKDYDALMKNEAK